jgi:asparagine synthase (glutamine-hydrolysing)
MCGIAGLINFDNSYVESIKKSLFHRGPDAQTHFQYKNLHLIHTRLSIQDIKNGDQPYKIGKYVIVFNGEIYNHLKLRSHVKNHIFQTLSDTETLLALFIEYGVKALEMVDGMFAFIIYDIDKNKLIIARDRIGKKPIYLYRNKKQLFIASELNVFTDSSIDLSLDEESIASYLRAGFFYQNSTPFNDIEEISPGHLIEIEIDTLKFNKFKYFDIMSQYDFSYDFSHKEAIDELDFILNKSVKDRLLSSDLDVGAFLSGGIDSSLIVAIATKYINNIKTFTVKFKGGYDESKVALNTSKKFNTNHHELNVSIDLKNDVEKILNFYGEPFMDSSAIPSYYISREAKKHVTVVLNGDGADELFAGYRRYVPFANNWINFAKYFSILSSFLPKTNNKLTNYNYLHRLIAMANKQGLDQYLSSSTDIFEDIYRFGHSNLDKGIEDAIQEVNNKNYSNLSKCLILDSKFILPNDLLKKMDIATMSNSLEGRSPFLSKYMLEWAPKLPDKEKIRGLKTKFILRELAKKYSLNEVYKKPKRGFEVPLSDWVENDLKENIYDSLNANNCYSKSYVGRNFINNLLNTKNSFPREKKAKILWNLYTLEIWHESIIKKNFPRIPKIEFNTDIKRNHILFLTTGLGLGGAERVVLDICKNINKSKYEVSVIGISTQNNMLSSFHKNKIHAYCLNYKKSIKKFISSIVEIKTHILNHDVQIIHAHMFHTLIIASVIKLFKTKIVVIFTPHNSFRSMYARRIVLWLLKPLRDIDTVFSKNATKFFYKSSANIIPNGINLKDYTLSLQNKPHEKFIFIVVGRLELMKNHAFLINLVSELSNYNFELQIVGSGLLENSLKSQVKELHLDGKIKFLGSRNDVPYLLSQSDCLLLPSLWEAFPIVLLEAAASNIPVISTPVGSISSFVNSDNGYLAKLSEFKTTMIEVMTNYTDAKIRSEKLYFEVKQNYQIYDVVKKYENIYKKVLQ